jgi:protein-L-isoaspartate(D-aspartate) O-methyltransferase
MQCKETSRPVKPMNFEQARFNMVEQQIRTWEVLDERVLDLFMSVHRENFVPVACRQSAFTDVNLPLDHGQTMMSPKVEGRLLQALQIRPADHILEIGTGSGHLTALLARSGSQVSSVDIYPDFTRTAGEKLLNAGIKNVRLETGDAISGWGNALYDVIAITGSLTTLGGRFQQQLRPNGRLFVVLGTEPAMEACLITRRGESAWASESLFETFIPPLIGAEPKPRFVF